MQSKIDNILKNKIKILRYFIKSIKFFRTVIHFVYSKSNILALTYRNQGNLQNKVPNHSCDTHFIVFLLNDPERNSAQRKYHFAKKFQPLFLLLNFKINDVLNTAIVLKW